MIDDIDDIMVLLDEISSTIDGYTDIYVIGGGAMMFMGSKEYTKDLDLVAATVEDYRSIRDALLSIGFVSDRPSYGMERANLSDTLTREDYRVDLFDRVICGHLQLSDSMRQRSHKRYQSENLTLYSCASEDIFLLKSITEREGDVADCNNLIRGSISFDWTVFIGELNVQMSFGNPVWITYVMERMLRMNISD